MSLVEGVQLANPEKYYVLGASFGVSILEERYRGHVVNNFRSFLENPNAKYYFNMLTRWCPEKILDLMRDGVTRLQNNYYANSM
jgi:hypothetical protein